MVIHTFETHYQMEDVDYEKQLQENTRQAAAEFAAITSTVLHKPMLTCNNSVENESICSDESFSHYSGRAVKETSADSSRPIRTNLEISVHNNNYVKANLVSPNEKLVNAIRSVLDGSQCEEPCSFPSYNRWYPCKVDMASQVTVDENGTMEDAQWYVDRNGGGSREGSEYECDVENACYDGDEMGEYVLDDVNVENASTYYIPESNIPISESNSNLGYESSIGCDNCKIVKQEFDEWKKQMLENFQILKLKVMSTDELISEHHKDCADLESERKTVKEIKAKLDGCYGETGALRIQLKKALQANEPLKKTVQRFEYEKSVKQQTIDELKTILGQKEKEITELKKISNSSRCLQEDFKKTIDDKGREEEKIKKKLLHQAKLIDKLTKSLTTFKQRHKDESKLLKKAIRENEKFKAESHDVKILKLSLTHQWKMLKRNLNNISPGKASKMSPIGVLSPSPSPPPTNVTLRTKHVKKAEKREIPKVKSFKDFVRGNLSSTSEDETDDEMEDLLTKTCGRMSSSHLFNIPTILSPPLSPIPPSPILDLLQETNTAPPFPLADLSQDTHITPLSPIGDLSQDTHITLLSHIADLSQDTNITPLSHIVELQQEAITTSVSPIVDLSQETNVTPLSPISDLSQETNITPLSPIAELQQEMDVTRPSPIADLSHETNITPLSPVAELSQEANATLTSPIADLSQETNTTASSQTTNFVKEGHALIDDSINTNECSSLFGDISQSDEEDDKEQLSKVCIEMKMSLKKKDGPVAEKIGDDHQNASLLFQNSSDVDRETLQHSDNQRKDCKRENNFLSSDVQSSLTNSKDVNVSDNSGSNPPELMKSSTNSSCVQKLGLAVESEDIFALKASSKPNIDKFHPILSDIQRNETIPVNLPTASTSSTVMNKKKQFESAVVRSEQKLSKFEITPVSLPCRSTSSTVMNKKEKLDTAVLRFKQNRTVSSESSLCKSIPQKILKSHISERKRKKIGNMSASSVSRNTRNAKFRRKWNSQDSTDEEQKDVENTVLCRAASNTVSEEYVDTYKSSHGVTDEDIQNNVRIVDDNGGTNIILKANLPDTIETTKSSESRLTDDKDNVDNMPIKNDVEEVRKKKMELSEEENEHVTTCVKTSIPSLFSTSVDDIKKSLGHAGSGKSPPVISSNVSDLIEGDVPCELKSCNSPAMKSMSEENYDSVCPQTSSVKDTEELEGIDNSILSGDGNNLHKVSAIGDINYSKCASDGFDSEGCLIKLHDQHPLLPNTDLASMVPDDYRSQCMDNNTANHSEIKKSPPSQSQSLSEVSANTEQYITEKTLRNENKVKYDNLSLQADRECNVDESVTNVTDDLDSEVASFKLPAQRCILKDPDDSSCKSPQQLALATTNNQVVRSIASAQTSSSSNHDTLYHTVYNSPSASRYVLPNFSQIPVNISTTSSSMLWSASSSRRQALNRRHSMYAYGVDTAAASSPSRLRIERTRSLSPTLFSPPSPPLSPIPPSPRRSTLTPVISPLPTTPLPESVSPLPPSPKITSPPLIRSSALLRTDDPSVFVPKPLTHSSSSAVKSLKFSKNDSPRSNRKKEDALNKRRSILEGHRARSCSPCFPKKSSNNTEVNTVNSNIITTSMSAFGLSNESRRFEATASASTEVQSPGSQVTSTSCHLHKSITKVCCYPYTTEEQTTKTSLSALSPSAHGDADSTSSALNIKSPIVKDSQASCMKNVVTTNSSYAKEQSIPCGKSRRLKSTVSSIEKRIKSMKSRSNTRYLNSSCLDITKTLNNSSKGGSRLELGLNSSLKKCSAPYSSSTITKPAEQTEKTPVTSVCLTSPYSLHANEITFSPMKVSSKNVWRRVDEKTENSSIIQKVETKKEAVSKVLPDLSSDDDALRIASESNASQEESDEYTNQTEHLKTTNLIKRDSGNTSQTNLRDQCSHIVTKSCADEIDNTCKLNTKSASYIRTLLDNAATDVAANRDDRVYEATIRTLNTETTDSSIPTENNLNCLEHVGLILESSMGHEGSNNESSNNESSPSFLLAGERDNHVNPGEQKGHITGEKRKIDVKCDLEYHSKKQDIKDSIKDTSTLEMKSDMTLKANNSGTDTINEIHSNILSNENDKSDSNEEGEIFDSNDDIEESLQNEMLEKQTFSNECEPVANSEQNVSFGEHIHTAEKLLANSVVVDRLEQFIQSPSKQTFKMRKKQSELGYVKKCFHDFQHKVISKKDVIFLLCQTSNLSNMKTFSTAIIMAIQKCEETLLHKILKRLENNNTCSCKIKLSKCIKCNNVECACKGNNVHKCSKCKKLTSKSTSNNDSKTSLFMRESRDTFMKCHPYAEYISPPVLTVFEKEMLTILVAVLKGAKFKTSIVQLLDDFQLKIISSEDILVCERLALCRMFAAVCRIYKKRERLLGFVFCVGYDMLPNVSYSMIFITCYSTWPSFIRRSDLVMQDSMTLKLILHKIKLSPLSAVLQFLALSESVERKESVSQKILESIMSVKYSHESTSFNYYEQFIEELCHLLEDTELSFVKRCQGNEIEICPFIFSTIKSIEMLCKRTGWQWTYNKVIVDKVWSMIKSYVCGSTDVTCDTAAIFIRLSGQLCRYGLSVKSDLQDYCQLLSTTLSKIIDSETVVDSVEISIAHTLLTLAPTYATECSSVLESWLHQAEKRNLTVSKLLTDAISDLQENL